MTIKDTYKYTIDLTRLINQRITKKDEISKLGNVVFKINLDIQKNKKYLAKIEKEIDGMVIEYSKKEKA